MKTFLHYGKYVLIFFGFLAVLRSVFVLVVFHNYFSPDEIRNENTYFGDWRWSSERLPDNEISFLVLSLIIITLLLVSIYQTRRWERNFNDDLMPVRVPAMNRLNLGVRRIISVFHNLLIFFSAILVFLIYQIVKTEFIYPAIGDWNDFAPLAGSALFFFFTSLCIVGILQWIYEGIKTK